MNTDIKEQLVFIHMVALEMMNEHLVPPGDIINVHGPHADLMSLFEDHYIANRQYILLSYYSRNRLNRILLNVQNFARVMDGRQLS